MVYDHMVKANGQYYQAGEDVPEIDTAGGESFLPLSNDDTMLETQEDKQYTKTDIKRMKLVELQELALKNKIDSAYDMTGEELKDALIEYFRL